MKINREKIDIERARKKMSVNALAEAYGVRFHIPEIPNVNNPKLATGAVIRGGNPFMAILGDLPAGKTNIEAPLATIEQAVENVMNRQGYGKENIPVNINVIYDGETTARVMIPDILAELGRQGYNVDVLGGDMIKYEKEIEAGGQ